MHNQMLKPLRTDLQNKRIKVRNSMYHMSESVTFQALHQIVCHLGCLCTSKQCLDVTIIVLQCLCTVVHHICIFLLQRLCTVFDIKSARYFTKAR